MSRRNQSPCRALFLSVCLIVCGASSAQSAALTFTIDSSVSYVQLSIPNFTYSGNVMNMAGQNRINGSTTNNAPWTTTTGNQSFFSGTLLTNVGGNLSAKTLTAIQFIDGANNLSAISSGNYRANPAAYNSAVSGRLGGGVYNNTSPVAGDFGVMVHFLLGNFALASFYDIKYNAASNLLPAAGTVGSGAITTNGGGNPLNFGISNGGYAIDGLETLFNGQLIPNSAAQYGDLGTTPNAIGGATYTYTNASNLRIAIPFQVPVSLYVGGGMYLNGTAAGNLVANAAVPEPSTLGLAGLGFAIVVVCRRRRRRLASAS